MLHNSHSLSFDRLLFHSVFPIARYLWPLIFQQNLPEAGRKETVQTSRTQARFPHNRQNKSLIKAKPFLLSSQMAAKKPSMLKALSPFSETYEHIKWSSAIFGILASNFFDSVQDLTTYFGQIKDQRIPRGPFERWACEVVG